ncbi:MAG: type II secretion system F family protein [Actinomycetota bacterium]
MRPLVPAIAAAWLWTVAFLTARAADHRAQARLDAAIAGDGGGPDEVRADRSPPRGGGLPSRLRRWGREGDSSPEAWSRLARSLSGALRAGRTLTRGLEEAAADPDHGSVASRLRAVLDLRAVGTPLDQALDELARPPSPEADLLLTVLRVGRRGGTGLPRLLDEYAASMRERADVAREVRSLTTQARLSGRVLCLLPLGFLGFVLATSGRDVLPAIITPAGIAALVGGLVLQVLGSLWIRALVRTEV